MSDRVFAVFDIGTTGARSVLVDEEGNELSRAYEEYPAKPRRLKTHEQVPEAFWRAAGNTMQRAVAAYEHDPEGVVAAIATTTRDCITPLDKEQEPLSPTVTWVDNRSSEKAKEIADQIGPRKSVNKILWFKENEPKIFERTAKFVHLDAYINNKLCGRLVSEPANARYGPIDHGTLQWSDELCEETGIPQSKLVDIVSPGTLIGEISAHAEKRTSLKAGTPVIMGSGDQQCSALGTGTIKSGLVKATTGTGTFVTTPTDGFIQDPYVMFSNPSAIPGEWILEGVIPGTGLAFRWYRDQFCERERRLADQTDQDVYDLICESAESVPAGSDGLVVFPFMAYQKGIFYNFGFNHTRAHVARAIMEANGYGIQSYVQMMEGMLELEFDELRIDGGGTNSPLWRQIQADCTNKETVLPRSRDSTVIGAAMLGTVGTKLYGDYEEAVDNMFHIDERREPIPEHVEVYLQRFATFNKLMMAEMDEIMELIS